MKQSLRNLPSQDLRKTGHNCLLFAWWAHRKHIPSSVLASPCDLFFFFHMGFSRPFLGSSIFPWEPPFFPTDMNNEDKWTPQLNSSLQSSLQNVPFLQPRRISWLDVCLAILPWYVWRTCDVRWILGLPTLYPSRHFYLCVQVQIYITHVVHVCPFLANNKFVWLVITGIYERII